MEQTRVWKGERRKAKDERKPFEDFRWRILVSISSKKDENISTSFFHLEDVTPFFMPPPTTAQTEHGRHLKFGMSSPQVMLFCITGAIFYISPLG